MKNILITGVSTGIGYATANIFLKQGCRVFGSVRNKSDYENLKKKFSSNFHPLIFDVTKKDEVLKSVKEVNEVIGENEILDALINNAGIALGGPLLEIPLEILKKQFEVNLFGLLYVTQSFSDLLGCNNKMSKKGKIIMISSVSGKRAYPFVGPYTASKHALEGLSDSLRRELLIYGVDVILIQPGPIKTAIWDKAPKPQDSPFNGSIYENALKRFHSFFIKKGRNGYEAEKVGKLIFKIFSNTKNKTRYVITKDKLLNYTLPGILPDRFFDKLIAKGLGLINDKKD
ncbi:MAG: oxidoreductase [Candidatus Marinimicrobia bacterium]|nr:oxidoreductase [Candidatus Neomarinimicrobiota bacterium]